MSAPHEFKVGDVVLAKIKGFPSWPGIIMDDENVPRAVLDERPSGKSSLHTIRFFPAADYHWASARDLKLLTNEDIDTFLEGSTRKSGDLLKAYKLAKDPHKWNAEQNRIVKEANDWLEEHGDEEEEEEEDAQGEEEDQEQEEQDNESAGEDNDDDDNDSEKGGKKYGAKPSTKASSKKRSSSANTSRHASSTKRARASEHESDDAKEADELVDGLEDRHKAGPASDASKTGDKEKATAATDAGADADADADADKDAHSGKEHDASEELDPATRKVREWRHRLQRAFLNKGGVIVARDMDAQDATFKTVEAYTDMTVDQLKSTKIGKVMKRIQQLADIPRDDEFHFRERAGELMKKWSALLDTQTEEDKQH